MDTFTFVVEMTKALAWPIVAVAVVLSVRKPVIAPIQGQRLQGASAMN